MLAATRTRILDHIAARNSGEFRSGITARDIADGTGLDRELVGLCLPYLIHEGSVESARIGYGWGFAPPLYRLAPVAEIHRTR